MSQNLFAKLVRKEISEKRYLRGEKHLEFEIGARVKSIKIYDGRGGHGETGVILKCNPNEMSFVHFDQDIRGHSGNFTTGQEVNINENETITIKSTHGWWMPSNEEYLELL
jgi:hypothetical protein